MPNTLCILTTHVINEAIISEYAKLARSTKCDAVFAIDNSNVQSTNKNGVYTFFDTKVNCFYFDQKVHDALKLPYYPSEHPYDNFGRLSWYNCDYRFYYIKKEYSNYQYYWQFENDVFFNTASDSYDNFLSKYENCDSDLIVRNFRQLDRKSTTWDWAKQNDWIYDKQTKIYQSFFPVVRLSASAVDCLYQRRLEHAKIFQVSQDKHKRWVYCECFTPTEAANNGFKCMALDEPHVVFEPNISLNDRRIFLKPDELLYHPVKTNMVKSNIVV